MCFYECLYPRVCTWSSSGRSAGAEVRNVLFSDGNGLHGIETTGSLQVECASCKGHGLFGACSGPATQLVEEHTGHWLWPR